jgi:hypothetical protein
MTIVNGHINAALSQFAAGTATNAQSRMIAQLVAPEITVDKQNDSYYIFDAADLRIESPQYSAGANVARVVRSESEGTYSAKEFALEEAIAWGKLANADAGLRIERRATAGLVNKLMLRREKAVADVLFATGTFTNTAALAAADRWDVDTSNPVKKVSDAREAIRLLCGLEPNTVVMGAAVWAGLRNHPDITSRVAGLVAGTPATEAQAAAALGVDRILVGSAVYNSAVEGGTASNANVWGKFASVCYIDPSAGRDVDGALVPMQQFVWDGVAAPFSTFTYESNESRSHIVQCYDAVDAKAITVNAAYLYSTVVS